jgi:hypothetical protein
VTPRISHFLFLSLPLHFKAATHNLESSNLNFKTQFVRYVAHPNAYWTGYFTSRPSFIGLHENKEWLLSDIMFLSSHISFLLGCALFIPFFLIFRQQGNWNFLKGGMNQDQIMLLLIMKIRFQ